MPKFFEELKRRNVFRVAAAYLVVSWVLLQVSDALIPALLLPEWSFRLFVALLALGFPIAVVLAWAFELTPEGVKRDQDVEASARATPARRRRMDGLIIAGLAVALGYFVVDKFIGGEGAEAPSEKSIAVLPFIDLSPERDQEYFADGISEELLNVLSKTPGLRVAARTSSFSFKGKDTNIQKIGEELNVATVLEGSVRKAGTKLRITAQLINVEDGFHIWSETYDRELTDVFAIQDEISRAIVDALRVHLVGEQAAPRPVMVAANMDAYNLYLLGRFHVPKRTKETLETALGYFEQAIEMDPNYAPAYAGASDAIMLLRDDPSSYGDIPPAEAAARAEPLIAKALALDPMSAEAHASLGLLELEKDNTPAAIEALRRAIALNPNLARAHLWLGLALGKSNREAEAIAAYERVLVLDPLSIPGNFNMAGILLAKNRSVEAIRLYLKLVELNPRQSNGYRGMGEAFGIEGQFYQAAKWYRQALEVNPDDNGVKQQLGLLLLELEAYDEAAGLIPELIGIVRLAQGRGDEAVELSRALLEG